MLEKNTIKLVPAIIVVSRKEWKKMPFRNYVIIEQGEQSLRVGCFIPEYEFKNNKNIIYPSCDEEAIIRENL